MAGLPFGRYRLVQQLGAGGMAVVYRAVVDGPDGRGREVVIKRMLSALVDDPRFVSMMASEAKLCSLLRHPNIVQVSEFGQVDGEYYIAMELVDGHDLASVMKRCRQLERTPPVDAVCHVIREVAGALAYAHSLCDDQGDPLEIVHRDVSPANVMVTPEGVVKLLDFGIAKAANHIRDDRTRTGTGHIKGKFSYMSPEQARGQPLDCRSDIFALGTLFYECLTAQRLFKSDSDHETLRRVCELPIVPPSQLVPEVPAALDAILMKMMARSPTERYQSCTEVVTALALVMEKRGAARGALARFVAEVGPVQRGTTSSGRIPVPDGGVTHPLALQTGDSPVPLAGGGGARRRWALPAAAAAALALMAWAALAATVKRPAPAGRRLVAAVHGVASGETVPPVALGAALVPASVTLRVVGTPDAEVRVDDALVGRTPLVATLARAAGEHVVTVRRPGFLGKTQRISGSEDTTVRANLPLKRKTTTASAAVLRGRTFDPDVVMDPFTR